MDAFVFQLIVLGLVLPLAVAGAVLALGWRMWHPGVNRHSDPTVASWAVAIGLTVSVIAILGWPQVPPLTTEQWLVWIILAAGLIGGVTDWWQRRSMLATPLRLVAIGVMVYLSAGRQVDGADAIWWVGGLTLVITLVWLLLDFQRRFLPEPLSVFGFATAAGFGGAGLVLGGTASLGQVGGVLGLLLGLLFLGMAFFPAKRASGAPAVFHALVTACLLLNGVWYTAGYFPFWAAALIFLSPLAASVYWLPPLARLPWWMRWGVAMATVLVLAGVGASVGAFPPEVAAEEAPYGY